MSVIVKAPKGPPQKGPSKTTVDKIPPVTIISTADEYTVVLTKTGIVPAAYPILSFDITGPPGWFYEVQVGRDYSIGFGEGPGMKSSWLETDEPFHRVHQSGFSTWTHGEKTLQLDGSGRAKYTMPVEWWKDQARQRIEDFHNLGYFYRALAFKDVSGAAPRFSTPNWGAPPNVTLHNNLTDFSQPVYRENESHDITGVGAYATIKTANRFEVREPDTWDMYCMVQWVMGEGRIRNTDGIISFSEITFYGLDTRIDIPEWTIDQNQGLEPRYRKRPDAHGPTWAIYEDEPGFHKIAPNIAALIFRTDFKAMVHLNCDINDNSVTIKTKMGTPPVLDQVIGVLPDPQPAILAEIHWKVRILMYRHPAYLEITHHDDELSDPILIDPLRVET